MNKDFNVLKDVLVSGFLKFGSKDLVDGNFLLLNQSILRDLDINIVIYDEDEEDEEDESPK